MTEAASMPWPEFVDRARRGDVLVLPVGAFEQHGPHLPLGTDFMIAEQLATALAAQVGGIVLPGLRYGAPSRPRSGGGDLFPLPSLTLAGLLDDVSALATGCAAAGARALAVVSWHWENAAVLWDALRDSVTGTELTVLLFATPWEQIPAAYLAAAIGEDIDWEADHAGVLETALMRHLRAELVGDPPAPQAYRPRRGYDVLPTPADAVPSSGAVNDARQAGADLGARCMAYMVEAMADACRRELVRP